MLIKRQRRGLGRAAAVTLLLLATACSTRVNSSAAPPAPEAAALRRPTRILITAFQVDPDAVRQDQGIGPRLKRSLSGDQNDGARAALATEVQSAISDTIVEALTKAGLPAEPAAQDVATHPGDLVVRGQVQRIDEGNRTRRMSVGFGAGKSIVEATADLYAIVPDGPPVLLQTYDGSADSGRKPGLAVGASMAVSQSSAVTGALSAVANVGGEVRRTPVGKEAASLGHRLARGIGSYAADRGWIDAAAVPAWTR